MVQVVTVARKEIMAFPRSQRSGKLDKERGRPGCDNVPRRHAPYRVDLILSITRRSPSVTVVTQRRMSIVFDPRHRRSTFFTGEGTRGLYPQTSRGFHPKQ